MKTLITMLSVAFKILIIASSVSSAYGAGLDDLNNYKKPSVAEEKGENPYSNKEIIDLIASYLDNDGVFQRDKVDKESSIFYFKNKKIRDYNLFNFEKCDELYIDGTTFSRYSNGDIGMNANWGRDVFINVLIFAFPKNNNSKKDASEKVKSGLQILEKPDYLSKSKQCGVYSSKYLSNFKKLLNEVIESTPSILLSHQNNLKLAMIDKEEKLAVEKVNAQKRANEIAIAQANEAKKQADLKILQQIEIAGKQEKLNKWTACKAAREFKLYDISKTIVYVNNVTKAAQKQIDDQKDAAKYSGLINKETIYQAGNTLAGAKKANTENFVIYKNNGGIAKNFESVVLIQNPCITFED